MVPVDQGQNHRYPSCEGLTYFDVPRECVNVSVNSKDQLAYHSLIQNRTERNNKQDKRKRLPTAKEEVSVQANVWDWGSLQWSRVRHQRYPGSPAVQGPAPGRRAASSGTPPATASPRAGARRPPPRVLPSVPRRINCYVLHTSNLRGIGLVK